VSTKEVYVSAKEDYVSAKEVKYGVALISRIDKIIGFCVKEPCKREIILQKRLIILSILPSAATPYIYPQTCTHMP